MNGCELGALRRHLFFSAAEAARWIAADEQRPQGVEERTWNRWEAGKVSVPENIAARMAELLALRGAMLEQARAQVHASIKAQAKGLAQPKAARVIWYGEADDYSGHPSEWRAHCSVLAELLALGRPYVELVPFDAIAFGAWRRAQGLADGPAERAEWAEQVDLAPPVRAKEGAAE